MRERFSGGGCVEIGEEGGREGAGDLLLYAPAVVAAAANRSPESADGNARAESALSGK